MKATERPWRIESGKQWDDKMGLQTIYGRNGETVCDNTQYYPHPVAKEDMELIIKCVNNWDGALELIENLKTALVNGCETEQDKDMLLELTYAFLKAAK